MDSASYRVVVDIVKAALVDQVPLDNSACQVDSLADQVTLDDSAYPVDSLADQAYQDSVDTVAGSEIRFVEATAACPASEIERSAGC